MPWMDKIVCSVVTTAGLPFSEARTYQASLIRWAQTANGLSYRSPGHRLQSGILPIHFTLYQPIARPLMPVSVRAHCSTLIIWLTAACPVFELGLL